VVRRVTSILLAAAVPVVLVARWIRLRGRQPSWNFGPEGPSEDVPYKRADCIRLDGVPIHMACTNSWWEHWWDGIQYCKDAKAECELYGGTFVIKG
jgi:hypothetical protein